MKIYKYELNTGYTQTSLPLNAEIVSVGSTSQTPISLWALVDPEMPTREKWHFYVGATGEELPKEVLENFKFLGTVVINNALVFHIYGEAQGEHC